MLEILLYTNLLLWLAVIALGVVCFALARQIGVLYERVAPAGALMMSQALKVGDEAPRLDVTDLSGATLPIGGVPSDGKATLLFFLAPDCPVCKTLLPALRSVHSAEKRWLRILLCSDGDPVVQRVFVRENGLDSFPYIVSERLGRLYGVAKLPFAVLIDEQGRIASLGLINSREHLESLFEAKERGVVSLQAFLEEQGGAGQAAAGR